MQASRYAPCEAVPTEGMQRTHTETETNTAHTHTPAHKRTISTQHMHGRTHARMHRAHRNAHMHAFAHARSSMRTQAQTQARTQASSQEQGHKKAHLCTHAPTTDGLLGWGIERFVVNLAPKPVLQAFGIPAVQLGLGSSHISTRQEVPFGRPSHIGGRSELEGFFPSLLCNIFWYCLLESIFVSTTCSGTAPAWGRQVVDRPSTTIQMNNFKCVG